MTSTEQRRRESRPQIVVLTGLVSLVALVATGCDTTAKVSFPSRSFDEVETSGMTSAGGACGAFSGEDPNAKLRFVMLADDRTSIRPSEKGGTALDSGPVNLTAQNNFTVAGGGYAFERPDLSCARGKEGDGGLQTPATWEGAVSNYDGTCSGDFSCEKRVSEGTEAMNRCSVSTGYSVENVEHVAEVDKDQVFGLLMENSPGIDGRLRASLKNGDYYDADGDGTAETPIRNYGDSALATDDGEQRKVAVGSLLTQWKEVREASLLDGNDTHFGLWTFSGDLDPESVVEQGWVGADNAEDAGGAVSAYNDISVPDEGDGNVLQSTYNLLTSDDPSPFAGADNEGVEKTLVVFADGPPEQHPGSVTGTEVTEVIEAAKTAGVRIFIVHLDPSLGDVSGDGTFGPEDVLDDPEYYARQDPCTEGENSCASHEVCREVRGTASEQGGEAEGSEGDKYCMPRRRPDGRTGPIEMYGRIACATGGGYQYVKNADTLEEAMYWLPHTMDGLWEASLSVSTVREGIYPKNGAMRLQGQFDVTAGSTTHTIDISQTGYDDSYDSAEPGSGDNRSTLFTGGGEGSQ